jgi:hypothetical protein
VRDLQLSLPGARAATTGVVVVIAGLAASCGPTGRPEAPGPSMAASAVVATGPTVVGAHSAVTVEPIAGAPTASVEVEPAPAPEPPPPVALAGAPLRHRYALGNARQTLTGDRGAGYDELYGTRNVRAVLNGVFFRGGANNAFHRGSKRSNKNPLPPDGLVNLCRQGFGSAIYLYPTNFETAEHSTSCQTVDGVEHTLAYSQFTTQHYKRSDLRVIFGMISDAIREPERGAVYAHCWNGWHASGYVAAVALRQFCGFTGPQALRYWTVTAKGAGRAEHDDTKQRIEKFKPFEEFTLTDEQKALLCPEPKTLAFPADEPGEARAP